MKNRGEINKERWWETRTLTEETAENSKVPGVLRKDLEGGGHPRTLLDTVGRQTRKAEKLAFFAQVSTGPQSPDSHTQPSRDLVREAGEPGCRGQVHLECPVSLWGGVWESEHRVHAKDAALRREGAFWIGQTSH